MALFFVRSYTGREERIRWKGKKMENFHRNTSCSTGNPGGCRQNMGNMALDTLSLAMGYVPMQQFGRTFDLQTGLQAGTIFPDLHKPFCGKGGAGC